MMLWFTLLCIAGFAVSLALIVYRHPSVTQGCTAGLIHGALWLLVWSLASPPPWLPATTSITLPSDAAERAEFLSEFSPAQLAAIDGVHLAGSGLTAGPLQDFPPTRLRLNAAPAAPAWKPRWNRELVLGQPLELTITATSGIDFANRLTLEDPFGNAVDSDILSAENSQLVLRDKPKLVGQWEYRVRVEPVTGAAATPRNDGETETIAVTRSEVLPVVVHAPQKPNVLVWLARPGFESAALTRWLRQSGAPAQVVTQLAPKMARREVFNDFPLRKARLLDADTPFDLLILDSRLWPQLSAEERQQLRAIAGNKSLLWLVHDDAEKDFLRYAETQAMPLQQDSPAEVQYQPASDNEASELPQLQLAALGASAYKAGDVRIAADERTIYWADIHPQQSLGFIFFKNSYRWQTTGFASEFSQLWSQIVARQLTWRGGRPALTVNPELPQVSQRTRICSDHLGGAESAKLVRQPVGVVGNGDHFLPVIAEKKEGNSRCYSFWAEQPGWHQVGSDFSVYVFENDSWPEWQIHRARRDSAQLASARLGAKKAGGTPSAPLPRYWLAMALLILLTLLWCRERSNLR